MWEKGRKEVKAGKGYKGAEKQGRRTYFNVQEWSNEVREMEIGQRNKGVEKQY
jgi:hypothetical protein